MKTRTTYTFETKVWIWPGGKAAWHFVSVPERESREIKMSYGTPRRGWGSIPVEATIGRTSWKTSIFPDSRSGTYLLPLKLKIRIAEGIADGDRITVRLKMS